MAKETTDAGMLGSWQRLSGSLTANQADLPHLEGSIARFNEVLNRTQDLSKQQAAFTAAKQEASRELRTLFTEGQRLANLLRLALKQHYGIRSEKLSEFGMQPFRGRLRKVKPAPENPETPTPEPPAPTDPTR